MDKKKLGLRIKELRELSSLTQEELAEKAGISRNYISSIENARYSPSLEVLGNISKSLDVTILQLLDNRVETMENRVTKEEKRLRSLFKNIPKNQLDVSEGLIIQAARLRVLLDDNWRDILENGEYEKFSQSKDQEPYDRKRPIVENYDNRDKTYKEIIKQLNDMLPPEKNTSKSARNRLLGK